MNESKSSVETIGAEPDDPDSNLIRGNKRGNNVLETDPAATPDSSATFAADLAKVLPKHFTTTAEEFLANTNLCRAIGQDIRDEIVGDDRNPTSMLWADPEKKIRVLRVADEFFGVQRLDARDTVAKTCCGKRFANLVFGMWKSWLGMMLFLSIWAVGLVLNTLGVIGVVPSTLAFAGMLLTLPVQTINCLLMSRVLAIRLLQEFETLLVFLLTMLVAVAYCDMLAADPVRAAAFAVCFAVNMGIILFNDALLQGSSSITTIVGYIVAFACITTVALAFQFGLAQGIHSRKIELSLPGHGVLSERNVLSFANMTVLTICSFIGKNIFLKVRHPGAYAVLRARVFSSKKTRAQLKQLKDDNKRATLMRSFLGGRKARKVAPDSKMDPETATPTGAGTFTTALITLIHTHFGVRLQDENKQLKIVERKIRGRLIHHDIFAQRSTPSIGKDMVRFRVMIAEEAFAGVQQMDQRDNLGRACCGKAFANMVFRGVRSWVGIFCFAMWGVGLVMHVLGIIGLVSPAIALVGMLMTLPSQTMNYILMSKVLVLRLLGEWETWLLILLTVVSTIAYCDVLRGDPIRAFAFAALSMINMPFVIFNDALMQFGLTRLLYTINYIVGLVLLLTLMLTFQLGIAKDIHIRKFKLSPAGVEISEIDVLLFANRRLLTISSFVVKNIYMKLRFPKSFAVLRARVLSVKTTKVEAQRALDGMMGGRSKRLSVMDKFSAQKSSRRHVGIRRSGT